MVQTHKQQNASGWMNRLERFGNRLPDPATLFALGALLIIILSQLAVSSNWQVERTQQEVVRTPVLDAQGMPIIDPETQEPIQIARVDPQSQQIQTQPKVQVIRARSLLSSDGLYFILQSMVKNFVEFPPLGVVLVGMLGIGVAERSGLIAALLRGFLLWVPAKLLTPSVFFLGVLSSMGLDAGYVVLPPIAAALFNTAGRSPIVGLATVFAGVSAGFSANLFITSLDPLLAEFSTVAAHLIDPAYEVAASANWAFMAVSTLMLVAVGWATTAWFVEPAHPVEVNNNQNREQSELSKAALSKQERSALAWAAGGAIVVAALFALAVLLPGAPLNGMAGAMPRWVRVIVPMLFIGFWLPGVIYGLKMKSIRSDRDIATWMGETMSGMGSYLVLAFFAAQFIAFFAYSHLGEMLAIRCGSALASWQLPTLPLLYAFILCVMFGNLLIGSMSAKYAFFAPVFVPLLMQLGISPELTQAAYRIGDSVTNVITPLNPYMVILLVFLRRYAPDAGIGTLIALMLPYSAAFALAWALLLGLWVSLGIPLGPGGPLQYAMP